MCVGVSGRCIVLCCSSFSSVSGPQSQPDFAARLSDVLELWMRALDGVTLLEHIKVCLKRIKIVAQDPMRGSARPGECA
jgi:hypothetical protein